MAANIKVRPTPDELREHLAYEVHYLIHAAVRFEEATGKDKAAFQDSALIHARNLLDFTHPQGPRNGSWWIGHMGGSPNLDPEHGDWSRLINTNAAHLGPERLRPPSWPGGKTSDRLCRMAQFALKRVLDALPGTVPDSRALIAREIATSGLRYLQHRSPTDLGHLANMVEGKT